MNDFIGVGSLSDDIQFVKQLFFFSILFHIVDHLDSFHVVVLVGAGTERLSHVEARVPNFVGPNRLHDLLVN